MNRIVSLIEMIERGEPITPATINQIETLIALDQVVAGDRFAEDFLLRQTEADQAIEAQQ